MILLISSALGQSLVLDPQNRLTVGLSWSDEYLGVAAGLDSRISQLVYVNIGAFYSLSDKTYTINEDNVCR